MIQCGWYSFPKHYCRNEATEFYISNVKPSKGVIPVNRAVCKACARSSLFERFSCTQEEHDRIQKENPDKLSMSARKVDKREWFEEEFNV